MSVIHKVHLESGITRVQSPVRPLSVGIDANGVPSVWYWAAETEHERESWKIELLGTGIADREREEIGEFLGTFVHRHLVLHAFVR